MAEYFGRYVYLSTHEFKSNIARWTQMLRDDELSAVIVMRYETPVAYYAAHGVDKLHEAAKLLPRSKAGPVETNPLI